MKKPLLVFAFLLAFTFANAQQAFLFRIKYIPMRLYESSINSSMNMQMDFKGDSSSMAAIKAKGIKLPMVITSKSNMSFSVKTGALKTDSLFPIALLFKNQTEEQTMNGTEKTPTPNPLIGQTIFAQYSLNGKMQIDSISGKTVDNQMKEALAKMISNMLNQINFPQSTMKIGDTFTQEVPMNLPLASTSVQITITIIYKLVSVENSMANFDMDESMNIDISTVKNSVTVIVKGSGKGGGKLVYDVKNNYAPYRNASLKMDYQVQTGNLNMTGAAQITATTDTKISVLAK